MFIFIYTPEYNNIFKKYLNLSLQLQALKAVGGTLTIPESSETSCKTICCRCWVSSLWTCQSRFLLTTFALKRWKFWNQSNRSKLRIASLDSTLRAQPPSRATTMPQWDTWTMKACQTTRSHLHFAPQSWRLITHGGMAYLSSCEQARPSMEERRVHQTLDFHHGPALY